MKDKKMNADVMDVTKQSIVAEAVDQVWSSFDTALANLDDDSRQLLTDYFNGTSVQELSRVRGISKREIETWITRSKRELIKKLRSECTVRQ